MFDRRLWRAARHGRSLSLLLLTILLSSLGGAAIVLQAYWLSQVVARVFLGGENLAAVQAAIGWLLMSVALRAALAWGRELSASHLAIGLKLDLRDRLFAHLLDLGPTFTQNEQTGELTAVLTQALDTLEAYFSQYLPQLFVAALIPLIILFVIFPVDWLTGLVLLLTAPLMPVFMLLIGRYAEVLTQRQWGLLSRMSAHFLDVLQGLTTLKQLGQSRNQAANIAAITDRFRRTTLDVLRVAFLSALVLELLSTISVAIIAVSLGLRLLDGRFPFAAAFFILILAPEFYLPLRQLGQRFHAGMDGVAAANRIFALLGQTPPPGQAGEGTRIFADAADKRVLWAVRLKTSLCTMPGAAGRPCKTSALNLRPAGPRLWLGLPERASRLSPSCCWDLWNRPPAGFGWGRRRWMRWIWLLSAARSPGFRSSPTSSTIPSPTTSA